MIVIIYATVILSPAIYIVVDEIQNALWWRRQNNVPWYSRSAESR